MERYLNVKIERTSIYPEIFLTEEEKSLKILDKLNIKKPYCIINAGFKNDMPLKQCPSIYWQQIGDELNIFDAFSIVQTGHPHHNHATLKSVKSVIGKTDNIRDYFSLIYHSIGVICHVSSPMHIAAAFRKPCIVIGGGRENFICEKYPDQTFLHSIGKLPCCYESGCGKTQFNECENLTNTGPFCYSFIAPKSVVSSVLERNNKHRFITDQYNVPCLYLYNQDFEWMEYHPKQPFLVLDKVYPQGVYIPKALVGMNIIHLPTVKTHVFTTITGAMKNAFGGLLHRNRHWTHAVIHDTLVDLLMIQQDIHPGIFAVMDGTFAGDGPGPRAMRWHEKDILLASADQVAIDAVSAKLQGFDPMVIRFIRHAHELGLGIGDPSQITSLDMRSNKRVPGISCRKIPLPAEGKN